MGVEKMSGIYIPGAKIPDGDYVRVLMLHKDGTCVDGIGNVFKVIPVLPHGRLGDLDRLEQKFVYIDTAPYSGFDGDRAKLFYSVEDAAQIIRLTPTVIPASESKERPAFLPQYELTPRSEEG